MVVGACRASPRAGLVPGEVTVGVSQSGRIQAIQRAVERHLDLGDRLSKSRAGLPTRPLSAFGPGRRDDGSPMWADYAWVLVEPGRLLDELGLRDWAESQGGARFGSLQEGI